MKHSPAFDGNQINSISCISWLSSIERFGGGGQETHEIPSAAFGRNQEEGKKIKGQKNRRSK